MLYNAVLCSAIDAHESATGTHTHPLPHEAPPHQLGCHRASGCAPCATQRLPISLVVHVVICVSQGCSLNSSRPLRPPLCHHGEPGWDPCVTQKLPTIYFTRDSVYMSILLSQFVPLSPFPTVSTSSFSTKFIGIIFLDSIYMC